MKMKQKYELMIIISSQITDPEIEKRVKELKSRLGDEIVYEEIWGMRDFAYPIQKQPKGYYVVWNFMMTAKEIKAFEDSLKLFPDLLRYLILQVPEEYTPMKLKDIEAGLEALRQEKAEKRGAVRTAVDKRKEKEAAKKEESAATGKPAAVAPKTEEAPKKEVEKKKEEAPVAEVPAKEKAEEKVEEKAEEKVEKVTPPEAAPEEKVEEPVVADEEKVEATPEEKSKEKKAKTLDEKLDDILSDKDLGL